VNIFQLLRALSFQYFLREWQKTAITLVGIILGVMIYSSIRLVMSNAIASFNKTAELVSGKNEIILEGNSGDIPETIIPELLKAGVNVAPQSIRYIKRYSNDNSTNIKQEMVQLIGVDLFSKQNYFGDELKINSDQSLSLLQFKADSFSGIFSNNDFTEITAEAGDRIIKINNIGDFKAEKLLQAFQGLTIIIDISQFQEIFREFGTVNRLGVECPKLSKSDCIQKLTKILPAGIVPSASSKHAEYATKLTEAFRLNLHFLACISVFVSAFLIYNMTSYSTLKRSGEFKLLNALGASARQLRQLMLIENLLLTAVGLVIGLIFGYLLSIKLMQAVAGTISNLYLPLEVTTVRLNYEVVIETIILALGATYLAAVLATKELKIISFKKQLILTLVLLISSYFAANRNFLNINILFGFISPTLVLFGTLLLLPIVLDAILRALRAIYYQPGIILALDHLQTTFSRNVISIGALMVSTGMFLGLSIMITSFRSTVQEWISHITAADIYISASTAGPGDRNNFIPEQVINELRTDPQIKDLELVSTKRVRFQDREIKVSGVNFNSITSTGRLNFIDREPTSLTSSDLIVSEAFSEKFNLKTGDLVNIDSASGSIQRTIKGVFYDYSSDQGVVYLDWEEFKRLFPAARPEALSLYINSESSRFVDSLQKKFEKYSLIIQDRKALRDRVLMIFDDTFRITYVLQTISLLISALTLLNTLFMLRLEREREFGVLRAIGANSKIILNAVLTEALLIGSVGAMMGTVLGVLLSLLLVFKINIFFFGWSVRYAFPISLYFQSIFTLILLTVVIGYLSGRRFSKSINPLILRYE
jgi:putative ABC transport system permease protein